MMSMTYIATKTMGVPRVWTATCDQFVVWGHFTTRAMLIWVFCASTRGHDGIWSKLQPQALCGFMAFEQPESFLISVFSNHWRPCWLLGSGQTHGYVGVWFPHCPTWPCQSGLSVLPFGSMMMFCVIISEPMILILWKAVQIPRVWAIIWGHVVIWGSCCNWGHEDLSSMPCHKIPWCGPEQKCCWGLNHD